MSSIDSDVVNQLLDVSSLFTKGTVNNDAMKDEISKETDLFKIFSQFPVLSQDLQLHSDELMANSEKLEKEFSLIGDNFQKQFNDSFQEPTPTTAKEIRIERPFESTIETFNMNKDKTIQKAIDKVNDGYTLIIPSGLYMDPVELHKNIHLIADDEAEISCNGNESPLTISAIGAVIEGFTFNQNDKHTPAVLANGGDCTFIRCKFISKNKGFVAMGCSKVNFINCIFEGSADSGLNVLGNSIVKCKNCNFLKAKINGIVLQDESSSKFINCTITDNGKNGVYICDKAAGMFEECTIINNQIHGFYISSSNKSTVLRKNIIRNHLNGFGLHIMNKGYCYLCLNEISDNIQGAVSLYENSSVNSIHNEYKNCSKSCSLICLSNNSTFNSDSDLLSGICKNGIRLTEESVLIANNLSIKMVEGDGVLQNNRTTVKLYQSTFEKCENGIQIQDITNVEIENVLISECRGNGIVINGKTSGFIKNTEIKMSKSIGLLANGVVGEFNVTDCSFIENKKSLCISNGCSINFENCIFLSDLYHSTEYHAHIKNQFDQSSAPIFNNCKFSLASTCLTMSGNTSPKFENCSFTQSRDFGVDINGSTPEFNECVFSGTCEKPAIFIANRSNVKITNSKISANVKAGLFVKKAGTIVTVKNTEISYHTADVGAIIDEEAVVKFEECSFFNNFQFHAVCRGKSNTELSKCTLHSSGSGKGIIIEDLAQVKVLNGTTIYDEFIYSFLIRNNSSLLFDKSEVHGCSSGFHIDGAMSKLTLTNSKIHHIAANGIVARAGQINVENNQFFDNPGNCISVPEFIHPILKNNQFKNNKGKEVFIFK